MIVRSGARLHLALIDLDGGLGRVDGGVGLALEEPGVEVKVEKSDTLEAEDGIKPLAEKILEHYSIPGAKIEIVKAIPDHIGLGSATQLALAVGTGITRSYGVDAPTREIARIVNRGGTSGIGVSVFETGGFVVDGGHNASEKPGFTPSHFSGARPGPVLARYEVPKDWSFVCAAPGLSGAHGEEEKNVFEKHCPLGADEVAAVSRIVLMNVMPAMAEEDIAAFGSAINRLQETGFKKIEIGLQDPVVKELLDFLRARGVGAGMSSFGPLCFGVVEGDAKAEQLRLEVAEFLKQKGFESDVFVSKAKNSGAEIEDA